MKVVLKISSCFFLMLVLSVTGFAQNNVLKRMPYLFDLGADESAVSEFALKLTAGNSYNESQSFGFLGSDYNSFVNENYRRETIRDEFTYDGIAANEIKFKINLPKGEWYFTFWMEAGYEDIPTTHLFIDGKDQEIVWHQLKAGAEGRIEPIDNYRVVHTKIYNDNNELTFSLKGESDLIQLLGFSFCPEPVIKNELHSSLYRIINEAGKYKSKVILDDLALSLKNNLRENTEDPFLFYWYRQVSLLAEAERYLNTQGWEWAKQLTTQSIFDRMHQALLLFDSQIENFDTTSYPLLERSMFQRGKLAFNLELERGGDYQKMIAEKDLSKMYERFPNDEDLAMLNGKKINEKDYCDNLPLVNGAPLWSALQREALCRLESEIKWWVEERQAPNGELGGKIGDDVEILRWWSTLLTMGDKETIKGWTRLANAVWSDPKVYLGFSRNILDVEHSSEFISDSTPELILIDTPDAKQILEYTAKYFRDLWTYKNDKGRRYFKSSWYSSTEVDERPPRNRDLGYNTRTVKPLRYLAWFTRKPEYIQLLHEWADGWLHAAMKTGKGKPKGIIPASIRYYDESINGDELNWYEPNMFWDYFSWSHDAGSKILDQLLFTYTLTGDADLLQPIDLSLKLVKKYRDKIDAGNTFEKGSEGWAAYYLAKEPAFWTVVQSWRMITGDDAYDDLIEKYGNPYLKFRLTGNTDYLIDALNYLLGNIRYNTAMRTKLVLHTDRVYVRGNEILKAMITGDGAAGNSPYYKVTWENGANDLTMLVTESDSNYLSVDLFSYPDDSQKITVRPWTLKPGKYLLTVKGDNYSHEQNVTINKPGQKIGFTVPSKQLVKLKIAAE